jgi:hypothetical protein
VLFGVELRFLIKEVTLSIINTYSILITKDNKKAVMGSIKEEWTEFGRTW